MRRSAPSFPTEDRFPERIEGNKQRLSSRTTPEAFEAFGCEQPHWHQLFEQLSDARFLDGLYALARPALRRARGRFGARRWQLVGEPAAAAPGLARRPVRVTFEFSRLGAGASVPAHTDASEKLISLLLFFPEPGWQTAWGGGTCFYRPRHRAPERNWHNRRVPFSELEPFFESPFVPNRLVGFVKSHHSYHGLPPIACPPGAARTSLNVHVYDATPALAPKRLRKLRDRTARRLERRGHPF